VIRNQGSGDKGLSIYLLLAPSLATGPDADRTHPDPTYGERRGVPCDCHGEDPPPIEARRRHLAWNDRPRKHKVGAPREEARDRRVRDQHRRPEHVWNAPQGKHGELIVALAGGVVQDGLAVCKVNLEPRGRLRLG